MERPDRTPPRILFVSPCGPYPKAPVDRDPVDFFYYRNTLGQGVFRLRSFQSWYSLHFLAQNLPFDSVVLENPDMNLFRREVIEGGFQVVAIGFTVITMTRVLEMADWLKAHFPEIDCILGGYGTAAFKDPDAAASRLQSLADQICYGEGLEFMRQYLAGRGNLRPELPLRQDFLPMDHSFFRTSATVFKQLAFVASLGCTYGCPFCATSSQFGRRRVLIASGTGLFALILHQARQHPKIQSAIIFDEDFLMDRARMLEFMRCMEECTELSNRPLLLTVFASVRSVNQYSMKELVRCGIGTIYIGVESFQDGILLEEALSKRDGDVRALFDQLHAHGINTLGSLIVGWDGHTPANIDDEIDRFVALNPTFYQVVPLHPVPGTPLWKRLKETGRLERDHTFAGDSIGGFTFSLKGLSRHEALAAVSRTYRHLVREGGPWPFRLYENLLKGHRTLSADPDLSMQQRSRVYGKLLRPVLPLAIASRVFIRGKGFRKRWWSVMSESLRNSPLLFTAGVLAALMAIPIIAGLYAFANLRYWLRPSGDQPAVIRREYRNGSRGN